MRASLPDRSSDRYRRAASNNRVVPQSFLSVTPPSNVAATFELARITRIIARAPTPTRPSIPPPSHGVKSTNSRASTRARNGGCRLDASKSRSTAFTTSTSASSNAFSSPSCVSRSA